MSDWVEVPLPPAPTKINEYPLDPTPTKCWSGPIPDVSLGSWKMVNQTLTVTGVYVPIVSATVSKETPFRKMIAITTGVSSTTAIETSFSVSMKVGGGTLAELAAELTRTTSHSTTLSEAVTTTSQFDIIPQGNDVVTAIWWQLVLTYTITGTMVVPAPYMGNPPFVYTITDNAERFATTQFPAAARVVNRAAQQIHVPGLFAAAEPAGAGTHGE